MLAIGHGLTIRAGGRYQWELSLPQAAGDEAIAAGVTLESGAQFTLRTMGNKLLSTGTVFTVLSNTSATPISGTFANLPEGPRSSPGRIACR